MKNSLLKQLLIIFSLYILYAIFYNLLTPSYTGLVTLEEKNNYFIPRQIKLYDQQKIKLAEITLDDFGNQTKIQGKIPSGKINVFYELTQNRKKFISTSVEENQLEGPAKIYYPNGKIWIEASYKAGKLNGPVREYYTPQKSIKRTSFFDNGKREGEDKRYYTSGHLYNQANFKQNELTGSFKLFYEKGNLMEESFYNNGVKTGASKLYYPSGKLYSITQYQNGQLIGNYTTFLENGTIKEQGTINTKIPNHKALSFYEDIISSPYSNEYQGVYKLPTKEFEKLVNPKEYNPSSHKINSEKQVINTSVQQNRDYFKSVEIKTKTEGSPLPAPANKSDLPQTRVIKETNSFGQNSDFSSEPETDYTKEPASNLFGNQAERIIRSNGNTDINPEKNSVGTAKIKKYYPSGTLYAELPYEDGIVSGIASFYYESGQLKAKINFKNNRKEGLAKSYFQNGKLESETLFMDDTPVSKKIYTENGQLIYSW